MRISGRLRLHATTLCGLCVAALTAGCGDSEYPLAPVSGVVTLDGAPLAGGVVNFQPTSSDSLPPGPGSTSRTDDQGRFSLKTVDGDAGAVVATHRVRIYSAGGGTKDLAPGKDMDVVASKRLVERVPPRYNYDTTLEIEVPKTGLSTADFALTTKP